MDLRDLALVLDAGIKEYEATYRVGQGRGTTELHTVLTGMRDQATQLVAASESRKDDLFSELVNDLWPDEEIRP